MTFHRRGAPDAGLAQAVGQPVDQRREALLDRGLASGIQPRLPPRRRLHRVGRQGHHLDAEARVDGLQPGREQLGDPRGVTARQRQADAERQGLAVQPVEADLELSRPEPLRFQPGAKSRGHVEGDAGHVIRRADRLGEGQAGEPGGGRTAEGERLLGAPQRLVQAGQRGLTEAAGERRAGNLQQLADAAQAQPFDLRPGLRLQPQGRRRQGGQQRGLPARRRDGAVLAEPRQRPGRARRVGDGAAEGQAIGEQPGLEVGQHRGLPAPQVIDPADIEEQAIRRIGRHGGREPHAPVRQRGQRRGVGFRLGLGGSQFGDQGKGVGGLLAGMESESRCPLIDGRQAANGAHRRQQGEGASWRA